MYTTIIVARIPALTSLLLNAYIQTVTPHPSLLFDLTVPTDNKFSHTRIQARSKRKTSTGYSRWEDIPGLQVTLGPLVHGILLAASYEVRETDGLVC